MRQQPTLFDFFPDPSMTITEVADTLSVSEASVRNWIKTGYLQLNQKNSISRKSFDNFCANIAGKEKLNKRANKSLLDQHDHDNLVTKIISALTTATDIASIGNEYQSSLSNAYRNKEGIYYTPESICDDMFSGLPRPTSSQMFCDPCCGSGNFIISAIQHGFKPENIYGYDTDPTAVEITKQRIFDATGYKSEKIICNDFLNVTILMNGALSEFDVILTNPPWGKKLPKAKKVKYGKLLGAGRSLDTSSLFFFAAMRRLKNGGFLAFLMPESFFKIAAFEDARRELLRYTLNSLRDFGKPFKGLLTKAQSFCMTKVPSSSGKVICINTDISFDRVQATFSDNPAHIINFESCPDDTLVVLRLFGRPHLTLERNASWGLGIVTGNNKKFCSEQGGEGLMPVYKS